MRDVADALVEDFVETAALEVRVDLVAALAGMVLYVLMGIMEQIN